MGEIKVYGAYREGPVPQEVIDFAYAVEKLLKAGYTPGTDWHMLLVNQEGLGNLGRDFEIRWTIKDGELHVILDEVTLDEVEEFLDDESRRFVQADRPVADEARRDSQGEDGK